ncbi:hypothetical protein COO60DRAFT_1509159 [Scenedesmus sp. NREL 46B-D3]|nr:hypothetical protein COO60DRAFT_1509159 [Scenedesmus sp. NREL 46B-D3]
MLWVNIARQTLRCVKFHCRRTCAVRLVWTTSWLSGAHTAKPPFHHHVSVSIIKARDRRISCNKHLDSIAVAKINTTCGVCGGPLEGTPGMSQVQHANVHMPTSSTIKTHLVSSIPSCGWASSAVTSSQHQDAVQSPARNAASTPKI